MMITSNFLSLTKNIKRIISPSILVHGILLHSPKCHVIIPRLSTNVIHTKQWEHHAKPMALSAPSNRITYSRHCPCVTRDLAFIYYVHSEIFIKIIPIFHNNMYLTIHISSSIKNKFVRERWKYRLIKPKA